MTRKEELEILIPRSKEKCYKTAYYDSFQKGLVNIENINELLEEVEYLKNLVNEIIDLNDSDL